MTFNAPLTCSLSNAKSNGIKADLHEKPCCCCKGGFRMQTQRGVLTLPFEFPDNYSQKCVLWRNMTPPDRHGSPPEMKMMKIKAQALPLNVRQVLATEARGAPRFLCHHSVILAGKFSPLSASCFPPVFPLFQLRRVPV